GEEAGGCRQADRRTAPGEKNRGRKNGGSAAASGEAESTCGTGSGSQTEEAGDAAASPRGAEPAKSGPGDAGPRARRGAEKGDRPRSGEVPDPIGCLPAEKQSRRTGGEIEIPGICPEGRGDEPAGQGKVVPRDHERFSDPGGRPEGRGQNLQEHQRAQ